MKSFKHFKSTLAESYLRVQERGSTYGVTVNWRGKIIFTQMFFPNVFARPSKSDVLKSVQKNIPKSKSFILQSCSKRSNETINVC